MTQEEAGPYLGKPPKTLAQWRYLGRGPAYIKFDTGSIRYDKDDLDSYLAAHRVDPGAVDAVVA